MQNLSKAGAGSPRGKKASKLGTTGQSSKTRTKKDAITKALKQKQRRIPFS